VVYYQTNPTPNWGPGTRAKVVKTQPQTKADVEGRVQGKRKSEGGYVEEEGGEAKKAKMEVEADEEAGVNA
jgi:hypothetical protein